MSLFSRKQQVEEPDYEKIADEFEKNFAMAFYKKYRNSTSSYLDSDFQNEINSYPDNMMAKLIDIPDEMIETIATTFHNTEKYTIDRITSFLSKRHAYLASDRFMKMDLPSRSNVYDAKLEFLKFIRGY